jgi:large subunit ribosomal protein L11
MVENKVVDLLVSGGQANAGPPLGPALGPLGVNVLSIVTKINELTNDYAGMKVPVKVVVNPETKDFNVEVGTPTTSALIVKALKIEKGSGTPNTEKVGDLSLAEVIRIAKLKQPKILAKDLKAAAKEVIGSCLSIGVTIEGRDPREIQGDIDEGKYEDSFKT